ncbi:MAG: FkbM family methyltransferase [Verrucomicrobia bacterium]|nr:FkbM family methyltransferase [Verrucomicrobiota bacterium]
MSMVAFAEFVRRRCGFRFPPLGRLAFEGMFKVLPKRVDIELFPGLRAELDFQDETMRGTYWQGSRFEAPTCQVLLDWAEHGASRFFDIGSNYGFFSWWLLSKCPRIQVDAFEPNPETMRRVESIRERNRLDRLRIWNIGLSDRPGRLTLHAGVVDSGHSTFGQHPQMSGRKISDVEVCTFATWLEGAGLSLPTTPQWVAKIDVEGFETKVLRGMGTALAAKAFIGLVVEANSFTLEFCGSSVSEVRSIMAGHGYQERQIAENSSGNLFFEPVR